VLLKWENDPETYTPSGDEEGRDSRVIKRKAPGTLGNYRIACPLLTWKSLDFHFPYFLFFLLSVSINLALCYPCFLL
jgi:hypothetical protein